MTARLVALALLLAACGHVTTVRAGRPSAQPVGIGWEGTTTTTMAVTTTTQRASRDYRRPDIKIHTGAATGDVWACIKQLESGGDYANRHNRTHFGAYQFSLPTWRSVGGTGNPADASPAEQDMRARMLQARSGWTQWSTYSLCH